LKRLGSGTTICNWVDWGNDRRSGVSPLLSLCESLSNVEIPLSFLGAGEHEAQIFSDRREDYDSMWTRRRIRTFALAFIAVMLAGSVLLRLTAVDGIDYCGNALFPDFAQVYVAGEYALRHQSDLLYDQGPFFEEV
jgi:hypothetical protein